MLQVSELFRSLQGETSRAGLPCAFVRLAGCDLRCRWCDARYAAQGAGHPMSIGAIVQEIAAMGIDLVAITGGEPLLQEETPKLAAHFVASGYTVLVETNGTRPIACLPPPIIRIVDFKCPSSGMHRHTDWYNLSELRPTDEVKFVLADRADYEYARDLVEKNALTERCHVLLGAVWGELDPALIAEWMLFDDLKARLQIQLHRILWPNRDRGV